MTLQPSVKTATSALLVCALLLGNSTVFLSSGVSSTEAEEAKLSFPKSFYRHLEAYASVLSLVETGYADSVDVNRAIARSIQRMLGRLDPHSSFYDPKTFGELRSYQGGNYSGIGVRVAPADGKMMVLSTISESPAEESGIRPGDVILSVDGVSTRDRAGAEVVSLLRGPRDTTVAVQIERIGVDRPLGIRVRRKEIPEPSLPLCYAILPGVAYLQLVGLHRNYRRRGRPSAGAVPGSESAGSCAGLAGQSGRESAERHRRCRSLPGRKPGHPGHQGGDFPTPMPNTWPLADTTGNRFRWWC